MVFHIIMHGNELDCTVQIKVDVDVCMKHDVPYMVLSMDILLTLGLKRIS